jgi:hypothetical protein
VLVPGEAQSWDGYLLRVRRQCRIEQFSKRLVRHPSGQVPLCYENAILRVHQFRNNNIKSLDLSGVLAPSEALVVVDGGARNGPPPFPELAENICYYCFEPSPQSIDTVGGTIADKTRKGMRCEKIVYPVALAEETGAQTPHITRVARRYVLPSTER